MQVSPQTLEKLTRLVVKQYEKLGFKPLDLAPYIRGKIAPTRKMETLRNFRQLLNKGKRSYWVREVLANGRAVMFVVMFDWKRPVHVRFVLHVTKIIYAFARDWLSSSFENVYIIMIAPEFSLSSTRAQDIIASAMPNCFVELYGIGEIISQLRMAGEMV